MKVMPARRGMPHTTSVGTLEGVYKQRQPGCSPLAPALDRRPRPQQRTSLRRSASLVLGQAHGQMAVSDGGDRGAIYPPESLPPLEGALPPVERSKEPPEHGYPVARGWPKWSEQPILLKEMPARLEGCRQKLAAADRELKQSMAKGSRGSPEMEYGEIGLLQRHLDDACKEPPGWHCDEDGYLNPRTATFGGDNPLYSKPTSPLQPPSSSATASFALGEPAPEPPLPPSSSGWEAGHTGDLHFVDEALAVAADEQVQDLRTQLTSIESQLLELDNKWRSAERERVEAKRSQRDLESKLSASEDRERKLSSRLDKTQAESQALRTTLGVSEGEARAMRTQLTTCESKEHILHNQVNALHARIYSAEGDNHVLRDRLEVNEQGQEALAERLKAAEDTNEAMAEREAIAEQAAREAKHADAEEIAQLKEAIADARMELACEKCRTVSAERCSTELREALQAALDRPAPAPVLGHLLSQETDLEDRVQDFAPHKLTMYLSSHISQRSTEDAPSDDAPHDPRIGLRPAQCQVDSVHEELRLVPLGVVGPMVVIPFKEIASITKDDNEFAVGIEWASAGQSPKEVIMQNVLLDTTDEGSLSAIIAALNMKNRIQPGSVAGTPATVTPRTPDSEDSKPTS